MTHVREISLRNGDSTFVTSPLIRPVSVATFSPQIERNNPRLSSRIREVARKTYGSQHTDLRLGDDAPPWRVSDVFVSGHGNGLRVQDAGQMIKFRGSSAVNLYLLVCSDDPKQALHQGYELAVELGLQNVLLAISKIPDFASFALETLALQLRRRGFSFEHSLNLALNILDNGTWPIELEDVLDRAVREHVAPAYSEEMRIFVADDNTNLQNLPRVVPSAWITNAAWRQLLLTLSKLTPQRRPHFARQSVEAMIIQRWQAMRKVRTLPDGEFEQLANALTAFRFTAV